MTPVTWTPLDTRIVPVTLLLMHNTDRPAFRFIDPMKCGSDLYFLKLRSIHQLR